MQLAIFIVGKQFLYLTGKYGGFDDDHGSFALLYYYTPMAYLCQAKNFIDPRDIIRAIVYYPLSMGRNFDERYRALIAMQTADEFSVATPADWRPGDEVIVPIAGSCGVAKERMESKDEMHCYDWFFCTKPLDEQTVLKAVLKK